MWEECVWYYLYPLQIKLFIFLIKESEKGKIECLIKDNRKKKFSLKAVVYFGYYFIV